jgi:hypothetical protein
MNQNHNHDQWTDPNVAKYFNECVEREFRPYAIANEIDALREQQEYQFYQQTTKPTYEDQSIDNRISRKILAPNAEYTTIELDNARQSFHLMTERQKLFLECQRLKKEKNRLENPSPPLIQTLCGITYTQSLLLIVLYTIPILIVTFIMYWVVFE